ncbi:MAG: 4Fe-4S single cluster domain-containing protein [Prevotella copri]|nr:4Fe-4S single cluster domain-containing protein [Segatella copri]
MNIARVLYPVRVLGPGNRIGIWVCGCHRACPGCSNPELWYERPEYEISIDQLMELINTVKKTNDIDGFTITGGEPMNQAGDLSVLVDRLSEISDDILVYSGYRLGELKNQDANTRAVLEKIAVLIDGEYIEEKNNDSRLRGSSNQEIHILNSKFASKYQEYLGDGHNQIQNFTTSDGIVSVGIHRKGFTP